MHPASSATIVLACSALVALALGIAAVRVDPRRLAGDGAHRFWGCATGVAVLWHAAGGPTGELHLLGATVACGLLGLPLGLLALAVGVAFRHGADGLVWSSLPWAFTVGALVPAAVSGIVIGAARRAARPAHGPCLLVAGAFLAGAAAMAASFALRAVAGHLPVAPIVPPLPADIGTLGALAAAMVMAEANLSAAVMTAVAAQRPAWLEGAAGADRSR